MGCRAHLDFCSSIHARKVAPKVYYIRPPFQDTCSVRPHSTVMAFHPAPQQTETRGTNKHTESVQEGKRKPGLCQVVVCAWRRLLSP